MSHEDLKSSAHVWGDGEENSSSTTPPSQPSQPDAVPTEAPPAYTTANNGNVTPSSRSLSQPAQPTNPLTQLAALASIPFPQYQILSSTQSSDHVTLTTTHAPFFTRPEALANLLTQQALLPPKPSLHITGTHTDGAGSTVTDFDISLSLLTLLNTTAPPAAYPSRLRLSDPPRSTPTTTSSKLFKSSSTTATPPTPLQTWSRHFCLTDKSENRSLTLTRTILDFDALCSLLEGNIRTLLASLQYRGKVGVAFPVQYRDVVVHKRPGNWLAGFLRLYPEQRYEVVEGMWELRGHGGEESGGNGAKVAEGWWRDWEGVVREAVLGKRKGAVGVEDWVCWKMGERREARIGEWGVDRCIKHVIDEDGHKVEERVPGKAICKRFPGRSEIDKLAVVPFPPGWCAGKGCDSHGMPGKIRTGKYEKIDWGKVVRITVEDGEDAEIWKSTIAKAEAFSDAGESLASESLVDSAAGSQAYTDISQASAFTTSESSALESNATRSDSESELERGRAHAHRSALTVILDRASDRTSQEPQTRPAGEGRTPAASNENGTNKSSPCREAAPRTNQLAKPERNSSPTTSCSSGSPPPASQQTFPATGQKNRSSSTS